MGTRPCAGPGPQRPCPSRALVRGRPGTKQAARCADCQRGAELLKRQRRPYDSAERREHEQLVAAWVAQRGYICPGCPISGWQWHVADQVTNPLTVDHVTRVADGGPRVGGRKRVMCRR